MCSWRCGSRLALAIALLGLAWLQPRQPLFAQGNEPPPPLAAVPWGLELPAFAFQERLEDGTAREIAFLEMRGQPLVIVLWATWCGICAREMPKLNRLASQLGPRGLQVVALSIDEGGSEIAARYLRRKGLRELRVFHDHQKLLYPTLGAWGVPTAIIADAEGRIVARASGPVPWESAGVRSYLLKHVHAEKGPRI